MRFLAVVLVLALASIVSAQITVSGALADNLTLSAPITADGLPASIGGSDAVNLDISAKGITIDDPAILNVWATAAMLAARAQSTLEVDAFFLQLATNNAAAITLGLVQFQADVSAAVTNFTAQRAAFIADLTNDITTWKTNTATLVAVRNNITATAGLQLAQRIQVLYDGWILFLQARNIEAKIFLGHKYTALAELKLRLAQAYIFIAQQAIAIKTALQPWPGSLGNVSIIRQQLVDLDTEVHLREAELNILVNIYAQAVQRAVAATQEVAQKLTAFRNKAYRKLSDIRADLQNAVKKAAIIDDIRRRVIAYLANVTDVQVAIDFTPGQLPRVTITVTKGKDTQDVVVLQTTLREVVKRILAAIATYDDANIDVPAVPAPTRKRGTTSDVYTVTGTYSAAGQAAASLALLVAALVARLF